MNELNYCYGPSKPCGPSIFFYSFIFFCLRTFSQVFYATLCTHKPDKPLLKKWYENGKNVIYSKGEVPLSRGWVVPESVLELLNYRHSTHHHRVRLKYSRLCTVTTTYGHHVLLYDVILWQLATCHFIKHKMKKEHPIRGPYNTVYRTGEGGDTFSSRVHLNMPDGTYLVHLPRPHCLLHLYSARF